MINRNVFKNLISSIPKKDIHILFGARQVGKSTLLKLLQNKSQKSTRYLNLENPLDLSIFEGGYKNFIYEVPEDLIFIDEFHYYPEMTSLFKAIWDLHPEKKIFATGSSSLDMSSNLKQSLVGRKKETIIYPFAFNEWLRKYNIELPNYNHKLRIKEKAEIEHRMEEFILYGALPGLTEISNDIERREYLSGIHQTYIAKDIKAFLKNESIISFNKMIEYLAVNNGGMLNINNLSKLVNLSTREILRHIEVMNGTFTLMQLRPLHNNKTKEITKTAKYYLYDQGVINTIIRDFRPRHLRRDSGVILEQFVFQEILKAKDIRFELKYWRTADGKEVDLVLEKDHTYLPIEIKTTWKVRKIPDGIKSFLKYYPECKHAVIICNGPEDTTKYDNCTIHYFNPYRSFFLIDFFLDFH